MKDYTVDGRRLLEIWKTLLGRGCKTFGSSDGTGVDGCGSQSGSNSVTVTVTEVTVTLWVVGRGRKMQYSQRL